MANWLIETWPTLASLLAGLGTIGGAVRYGPKIGRRIILMLDCEVDRLRWEEADKLRNRELTLLRQDVTNLQDDVARLLARLAVSGAGSGGAATAADPPTSTSRPSSSAT